MGFPYPGGVHIDNAAKEGDPKAFRLPHPAVAGSEFDFSFSGLKTNVINLLHNAEQKGIEKLNIERVLHGGQELFSVAACMETAKAEAFGNTGTIEEVFRAAQASASMPYVSRPVEINGKHYLDGGCVCKIPYKFALERDFEKIVVVRTRTRSFRKPMKMKRRIPSAERLIFGGNYPEFAAELARSHESYDRQCDELETLEAKGRIFVIAPSESVAVSRLERDIEKLGRLYHLGYNDAMERMDSLKNYLGIK